MAFAAVGLLVSVPYRNGAIRNHQTRTERVGLATFEFDEPSAEFARAIEAQLGRALEKVVSWTALPPPKSIRIEIVSGDASFRSHAGEHIESWAAAVTEMGQARIVIRSDPDGDRSSGERQRVFEHELVHAFLGNLPDDVRGRIPRWFHEGVADAVSRPPSALPDDLLALRMRLGGGYRLRELQERFPQDAGDAALAYFESRAVVEDLVRRYGRRVIPELLTAVRETGTFDGAMIRVTGRALVEIERDWRDALASDSTLFLRALAPYMGTGLFLMLTPLVIVAWARRRRRARAATEALEVLPLDVIDPATHELEPDEDAR